MSCSKALNHAKNIFIYISLLYIGRREYILSFSIPIVILWDEVSFKKFPDKPPYKLFPIQFILPILQTTQDLRQQLLKDGFRLDEVPDDEELDLIPPRPMVDRCACCQPQANCTIQWHAWSPYWTLSHDMPLLIYENGNRCEYVYFFNCKKDHYTSPDQVEPKRWRKRTWQRKNRWLLILGELNYGCERDIIGKYHKDYECVYQNCFQIEECWKSILWWCTCVFWNAAIIFFLNLCYANCVYCSCLLLNRWYIVFMPNTCFFLFQFFFIIPIN